MTDTNTTVPNIKIEPLNGVDDWSTWQTQMEDLLWDAKLWGYVDGTKKKPADEGDKEMKGQEEWALKDRTALNAIRRRVGKHVMKMIKFSPSSKDAWDKLRKTFEAKGLMRIIEIRRKLLHAMYSESDDIDEFLDQMVEWREDLVALGREIPDDEFSIALLSALPQSWDPFVSSINLKSDLNPEDVMLRVREQARRSSAQVAMFAQRQKLDKRCYKCGNEGHIKRDCPQKKKGGKGKGKEQEKEKDGKRGSSSGSKAAMVAEESDSDSDSDSEYACTATDQSEEIALSMLDADSWIADTGTTVHVARQCKSFTSYTFTPGKTLRGAGSTPILGRGTVKLRFVTEGKPKTIELRDVVHALGVPHNLISVGRVEAHGHRVEMINGTIRFVSMKGHIYATGKRVGNYLYHMDGTVVENSASVVDTTCAAAVARPKRLRTWDEWHRVYAHMGMKALQAMKQKDMVVGMEVDEMVPASDQCEACVRGKQTVAPFPKKSESEAGAIGDLTVMGLWGKASVTGIWGEKYFSTFTDAHARHTVVELSKAKTDELEHFKRYQAYVKNQFGITLKTVRCDNGGEYLSTEFTGYLRDEGIELQTTAPRSSAQNGIAEWVNRTVMDRAMALIIAQGQPKFLWPLAVKYVVYLKNRSPTRALKDRTPSEVWTGTKPDVSALQEWGSRCWVLTDRQKRTKLDPKSEAMLFMGMADRSKAWKFYDPRARRIGKSRNIIFTVPRRVAPANDDDFDFIEIQAPAAPAQEDVPAGGDTAGQQAGEPALPRLNVPAERATSSPPAEPEKSAQPPERTRRNVAVRIDYKALNEGKGRILKDPVAQIAYEGENEIEIADEEDCLCLLTLHGTESVHEPHNLKEAMVSPEWPKWQCAMEKEIAQLRKLGAYSATDLPPGRKAVGCRWVFRIKRDTNGRIVKFKARLVAQGFSQIPGLDFFETFAPVVRMDSIRLILAIAAQRNMVLHQYDVVGAYLNADLDEEIYMRQPPGYEDGTRAVVRLHKALYGLKQGGRAWNQTMNSFMVDLRFRRINADVCVYVKETTAGLIVIGVHVDDMLASADNDDLMNALEAGLRKHMEITDLGSPRLLLGIEISHDRAARTLTLSQSQYVQTVLDHFGMGDCNPVSTPLDPNVKLVKEPDNADLSEMKKVPYQALIGSLMYAALGTRPDIKYAVQALSQFNARPGPIHWTAAKRVLRYLKGTQNFGITYTGKGEPRMRAYYRNLRLEGYTDADWASNPDDCRSVSGYVFLIGNAVVAWSSKKQTTVALSSMEAEYMAIAYTARHAIWMRAILTELTFTQEAASRLNADNQSAIALSKDNVQHARSKHIDIRHHFIRECIVSDTIRLAYCPTDINAADLFTKALPRDRFQALRTQLGILPLQS